MQWTEWIESLRPDAVAGSPSPPKPLLLIYLLARAAAGFPNEVSYKTLVDEFQPWLDESARSRGADVRLPFWGLQGDYGESWRIESSEGAVLAQDARGVVDPILWNQVVDQGAVAREFAQQVADLWLRPDDARSALARFDGYEASQSPTPRRGGRWTREEFEPLIEAYMAMLTDEIAGQPINKAKTRRALLAGPIANRTNGSIEMKMQNVSSVLAKTGLQWIQGYKPLGNTQGGVFWEAVTTAAQNAKIPRIDEPTADLEELDRSVRVLVQQPLPSEPPEGDLAPPRVKVSAQERVVRDPKVVAYVLKRADGTCECCSQPAPFVRSSDETPFLEVHHLERLADGGADTVANACAVCPNCHRELHLGVDADELLERVRAKLAASES